MKVTPLLSSVKLKKRLHSFILQKYLINDQTMKMCVLAFHGFFYIYLIYTLICKFPLVSINFLFTFQQITSNCTISEEKHDSGFTSYIFQRPKTVYGDAGFYGFTDSDTEYAVSNIEDDIKSHLNFTNIYVRNTFNKFISLKLFFLKKIYKDNLQRTDICENNVTNIILLLGLLSLK